MLAFHVHAPLSGLDCSMLKKASAKINGAHGKAMSGCGRLTLKACHEQCGDLWQQMLVIQGLPCKYGKQLRNFLCGTWQEKLGTK